MRTQTTAAQVAKTIRTELKKRYPSVKFQVTCSNYAGGNSVRINSTDVNPTIIKAVEAYVEQFKAGNFDGMTDMYVYDSSKGDLTVSYVFVSNYKSDDMMNALIDYCCKTFGEFEHGYNSHNYEHDRMINSIFHGSYLAEFSEEFWASYEAPKVLEIEEDPNKVLEAMEAFQVSGLSLLVDELEDNPMNRASLVEHLNKCFQL